MGVWVCGCVCGCARARARVCVCMCVLKILRCRFVALDITESGVSDRQKRLDAASDSGQSAVVTLAHVTGWQKHLTTQSYL